MAPVDFPRLFLSHSRFRSEIVQAFGKSSPGTPTADKIANPQINDSNDLGQLRELAHVLRTGLTLVDAQRERRWSAAPLADEPAA